MNNAPLLQRVWKDIQPVLEDYEKNGSGRRYGGLAYEFLQNNMDQLISDIEQSANRVASIAKGLKDFSRKVTSSEKLPVNINVTIENAVRLAGSTLHKSGIELGISLEPDLPTILANPQHLEQIALNLIINAVQAIDHDHGYIKIATAHNEKTLRTTMTVEDNGRGIDSSISDKIFDPFFTGRQKEGGTGLGLSITHNLVKINNGTISFNSQKGKGTVFSVSFPTRPVIESAKILLVDDEEAILKVMEKALTQNKDYIIEKADNGHEALIKMGIFSPDLLILDIFMPEMDGLDVIRAIKNQSKMKDMKIIVISGHPEHKKIKQVIEMGVTSVLSKPLGMKTFTQAVEAALKEL
jgi:CheY-like chemotaxis protein/two-component sensor histidine kinase